MAPASPCPPRWWYAPAPSTSKATKSSPARPSRNPGRCLPDLPLAHWIALALAAVIVGAAKTGIPGLGFLAVPIFAFIYRDARLSAGALLPLLCVADALAIYWYRKHAAAHRLWELLPWVALGMGVGALCLWLIDGKTLMPVLGGIILAMIGLHLWRKRHPDPPSPGFKTTLGFGLAAGTTTTIANAAGPVMSLFLLAKRLPKEEFIATGAWFFFIVNLAKIPVYAPQGMITASSLLVDLALVPGVLLGTFLGRRLINHIPQQRFEQVVLVLAAIAAIRLVVPA